MNKQAIKTLADAEAAMKETPHLYHIAFIDEAGRPGSTVIGMKEDAPLYKPYFIFNEINKDRLLVTVISIVKLTPDEPIITSVDVTEKRKAIVRIISNQFGEAQAEEVADKIIREV